LDIEVPYLGKKSVISGGAATKAAVRDRVI
jgi:hypothetical protein